MEKFLIAYGLWAVFFGSMFEGDIIVPTAGAFAAFGYLDPLYTGIVAVLGIFAGDCFWYWIGRLFGERLEGTRFYKKARPRAERFADRFGVKQIILARFIWGVRMASMMLWGFKKLNFAKFAAVDLAGAAVFGGILTALGYVFSRSVRGLIEDFRWLEVFLGVGFIVVVIVFFLARRRRKRAAAAEA